MWLLQQADAVAALPEIVLAILSLALLMFGVFRKDDASDAVTTGALVALAIAAALVIWGGVGKQTAFNGAFVVDSFARVMKVLALFGSAVAVALSVNFMKRDRSLRFEYPIIVLLATVGMMMMISANNLIALYMGLELQSLALYVVAAINRDSARASEAGLKLLCCTRPGRRIPRGHSDVHLCFVLGTQPVGIGNAKHGVSLIESHRSRDAVLHWFTIPFETFLPGNRRVFGQCFSTPGIPELVVFQQDGIWRGSQINQLRNHVPTLDGQGKSDICTLAY